MKKFLLPLIVGFAFVSFFSCRGFEEQDITQLNNVSDIITQGDWKISSYLNNNQDQTNEFTNYTFAFKQNGTVTATDNGIVLNGAWLEDKTTKEVLIRFTNGNVSLEKLNNVWTINSKNLKLVNMVGSVTPTSALQLEQR
jgi:hypothetical protein